MQTIREVIRNAMAEKCMSEQELAKAARLSIRTVQRILSDDGLHIGRKTLSAIAEPLGIDKELLFSLDAPIPENPELLSTSKGHWTEEEKKQMAEFLTRKEEKEGSMINAIQAGNRLLENGFELTKKNGNSMFRKSAVNNDVTIDVTLGKDTFTVRIYEQLDADEFRDIAVFSADYNSLGIDITKSIGDDGYSYTFRDASSSAAVSIR